MEVQPGERVEAHGDRVGLASGGLQPRGGEAGRARVVGAPTHRVGAGLDPRGDGPVEALGVDGDPVPSITARERRGEGITLEPAMGEVALERDGDHVLVVELLEVNVLVRLLGDID